MCAEQIRDVRENLIPHGMTAAVVDVLESVEIQHHHGAASARGQAIGDEAFHLIFDVAAIGQGGERVVGGQVFQVAAGAAQRLPRSVQSSRGSADLLLHVVERDCHRPDLVARGHCHGRHMLAGAGLVEVYPAEGVHRPGEFSQSTRITPARAGSTAPEPGPAWWQCGSPPRGRGALGRGTAADCR